jgi:hypothetical protein
LPDLWDMPLLLALLSWELSKGIGADHSVTCSNMYGASLQQYSRTCMPGTSR